ncbi:MAG TPA: hypothetical protein VFH51_06860, partial [Myxococcota bacterium]|nr:hypothetical protein [Myxococcota bacterium]
CERLPGPELQALIAALCMAVDPSSAPPGADAHSARWAAIIAAPMTVQIRAAMAPRVAAYLKIAASFDINRWRAAAVATANRAALLLCADIDEAITALLAARGFDASAAADRAAVLKEAAEELDLFRFAQSDSYFNLRKSLGLALRKSK